MAHNVTCYKEGSAKFGTAENKNKSGIFEERKPHFELTKAVWFVLVKSMESVDFLSSVTPLGVFGIREGRKESSRSVSAEELLGVSMHKRFGHTLF